MNRYTLPHDWCRACGAEIIYVYTLRGAQRITIDATASTYDDPDALYVRVHPDRADGHIDRIETVPIEDRVANARAYYVPHSRTCPRVNDWRGTKKVARYERREPIRQESTAPYDADDPVVRGDPIMDDNGAITTRCE